MGLCRPGDGRVWRLLLTFHRETEELIKRSVWRRRGQQNLLIEWQLEATEGELPGVSASMNRISLGFKMNEEMHKR